MGDLLMDIPSFRALKETFDCRITLLTSPMAEKAAGYIKEIDEVIPFNAPWNRVEAKSRETLAMVSLLQSYRFDGCIIFTVYSQNPLPAALLAFMADIPKRLAYCRENPYGLLTHWLPDKEPYTFVQHQVRRDLNLVKSIGAVPSEEQLALRYTGREWENVVKKLPFPVEAKRTWIIMHTEVSEEKREYPVEQWIRTGNLLSEKLSARLLFTGTVQKREAVDRLCSRITGRAYNLCGILELGEFIALLHHASLIISVNTATVHIAAAVNTPVVVLYALTNPQHTPWNGSSRVLTFQPQKELQSKNEVVRFVYDFFLQKLPETASPQNILRASVALLHAERSGI